MELNFELVRNILDKFDLIMKKSAQFPEHVKIWVYFVLTKFDLLCLSGRIPSPRSVLEGKKRNCFPTYPSDPVGTKADTHLVGR